MTQPNEKQGVVTQQKAWTHLMKTMGIVNLQRVRDARKAANELAKMKARR